MKENFANEVLYYTFPQFEKHDFAIHAFSSREGGVSSGYYSSMNLGINTPDERANVEENYRIFFDTLGLDIHQIVLAQLTHETNIRKVTAEDEGIGLLKPFTYERIDGLVTNVPGPVLTATFADCVPVFFMDPVQKVVGIVHSGWRGTLGEISGKMVDCMVTDYGCDGKDILIGIGPSIGVCCFEVGREVFDAFNDLPFFDEDCYFEKENGKFDIDLWKIIWKTLTNRGIMEKNISISGLCTMCNKDVFFSHRGSNGKRGTMAGVITIKQRNE